ncbi:uncharacterized protein cubi_03030 [Cryptosporidium ubiquitum]|uniref:Uncharacterized protein n=1 Tax=Cryptosporidium ubiquitum TaxID=857276 RepID=A0A1J4MN65_9CRYT|nr:uncharacterized protein cubi_03030 [Cryptosporidium ubiquitum]OII74899.1 hypothetical protein cubi_03030 [Cryptosporidium ubiquitum]
MEEINVFLKFFEKGSVNLQKFRHESDNMKKILFSIFKAIIKDLDRRTVVDDLIKKFEIDNSSLWNSFELILKPELKKLSLKVENITKQNVDFELCNLNSNSCFNKTLNQAFPTESNEEEFIKKNSEKYINEIESCEKFLVNDHSSIQDNENVDFFDYDEMAKFVDQGVKNPNFDYNESDISDFSDFSAVDDASKLKYDDFFLKKSDKSVLETSPEDYEFDHFSLSETGTISDKNEVNENSIKNVQYSDPKLENISKLSQEKNKIDAIIDELEANIIKEKEWYKLGESSITDREKNSLLNIHLEVPQFSSTNNSITRIDELNESNILSEKPSKEEINPYLENIIRQRILNNLFDDVEPKIELLRTLDVENKNEGGDIQVEKSKLSLAEIYSKKYEEQIIGNINEEYSDEKKQLSDLFTEIMCKLDNLSNQYYATNLPILKSIISNENAPALKTEDAIPVIISDNTRLAPQELKSKGKLLVRSEMTRSEKKSDRNSIKRKLRKRNESVSGSKKEYTKLKDNIKDESLFKKEKLKNKSNKHESLNKRFKSHHFIS